MRDEHRLPRAQTTPLFQERNPISADATAASLRRAPAPRSPAYDPAYDPDDRTLVATRAVARQIAGGIRPQPTSATG